MSEISFPSLTPSAEWGAPASSASSSDAARTWSKAAPALKHENTSSSDSSPVSGKGAGAPSYAPPVIISRAKIAEEIRKSRQYDDDRYYEEPSATQKPLGDDDGWKEVTVRRRSAAPPMTKTRMAEPPQKQQYDDYEDEDDY